MIVFGDSGSDTGNVYHLTNQTWPSNLYYKGRFCNGPIWIDHLRVKGYTIRSYAYGGATTDNSIVEGYSGRNGDVLVPSIVDQVGMYLHDQRETLMVQTDGASDDDSDDNDTIAMLRGGGNDAYQSIYHNMTVPPSVFAKSLVGNVEMLVERAGIQNFIVFHIPPVHHDPYFRKPDNKHLIPIYENWIEEFNRAVDAYASEIKREEIKVVAFDINRCIENVIQKGGFENVEDACLEGRVVCEGEDGFVFWDEFHWTSRVQEGLAGCVGRVLPEMFGV